MAEKAEYNSYLFPKATQFGRRLAKEKIYLHAKPGNKQRQLFIHQVEKMQWQFKLAPETVNLPASKQVLEIQVIDIWLKADETELDEVILRLIDKVIKHPIYYRIYSTKKVQFAMAWKRPHETNKNQWVIESYLRSSWQSINKTETRAQALPVVTNMAALYDAMLSNLLEIAARPEETLAQQLERINQINIAQKQLQKLESQLKREKQYNRKVEINGQINQAKQNLNQLADDNARIYDN